MVSRSRHYLAAALAALILPSVLSAVEAAASPADLRAGPRAAVDVDLTVGNATLSEAASTNLEFTVTLSQKPTSSVFVFYETADRTAEAGADYTQRYGWLSFSTTQRVKTLRVPVLNDDAGEASEKMTLKVSRITGPVTIADGAGVGTIRDKDPNKFVVQVDSGGANPLFNDPRVLIEPGGRVCASSTTPCGYGPVADNTSVTLTAQGAFGGFDMTVFRHWTGACAGQGATCSLVIAADTDVTAVFEHIILPLP